MAGHSSWEEIKRRWRDQRVHKEPPQQETVSGPTYEDPNEDERYEPCCPEEEDLHDE